jgi:hypothetical protein
MRRLLVLGLAVLGAASLPAAQAAGPEVNISRLPGPQSNATIAVHPTDGRILLAGSNSVLEGAPRVYASVDGGLTWRAALAHRKPSSPRASCSADPGVAIAPSGRQYYSFVRAQPCREGAPQRVYVVTRAGATASWSKPILVAGLDGARFDDKPAIAVDASPSSRFHGRAYLAWTRLRGATFSIVLSHSDNGGRTWSRPVRVNRSGRDLTYASVAVSRTGAVYVAWTDVGNFAVKVARSTDGGTRFVRETKVAAFVAVTIPRCGSGIVIPAQPRTCVQANPIVSVDASRGPYSGRVYVSYAKTEFRGMQAAHVAVYDPALRAVRPSGDAGGEGRPVAPSPAGERSDQFWPQSAVDASSGVAWVCFYDTLGDPTRRTARYWCTLSRDGGVTWARPLPAASVASDETQPGSQNHYGFYQGLAVANGVAHPAWADSRHLAELAEEIYTTRLTESDFLGTGSR